VNETDSGIAIMQVYNSSLFYGWKDLCMFFLKFP